MKYINQKNYPDTPYITRRGLKDEEARERGKHTTVARSGCGLCCGMMVVDRLLSNTEFSLEDAIQLSYEVKANREVGTNYEIFAPALAERFGLELEMTNNPRQLSFCLRTGGCAVAHVGGDHDDHIGLFSHKGHYVAVIAEQKDGRLVILDPSLNEGKFEEEERKGKVEVSGNICITEAKWLAADVLNRNPGFYLFWRK